MTQRMNKLFLFSPFIDCILSRSGTWTLSEKVREREHLRHSRQLEWMSLSYSFIDLRKRETRLIVDFFWRLWKASIYWAAFNWENTPTSSYTHTQRYCNRHHVLPSTNDHCCRADASELSFSIALISSAVSWLASLLQLLILCWARPRYVSEPWLASSINTDGIEEMESNESDLLERAIPLPMRLKKAFRSGYHFGNEDRHKKYLGESASFKGGHSLQGLWAMPGRR